MDSDKFNKYLEERYEKELEYYDNKAIRNKNMYHTISILTLIISGCVSFFIYIFNLYQQTTYNTIAMMASLLVSILTAILSLCKFHENWLNYRSSCETLKKEKHFFDAKIGEYRLTDDPEALFVERVEQFISKEHTTWLYLTKKKANN